jgi:fibro-slime domain-containing protein
VGCGDGDGDSMIEDPNFNLPPTANCGDGVLDDDEVCDDGGLENGDGCYGNCRGIEVGYICPKAGQPCIQFAVCGDGITAFPEQCDDGSTASGDGCNENCKLELGFKCTTDGVSVCSPTTCGDDIVEGAEMCEPSQTEGCTSQCQFAPDCSGDGACTSECGDGLVLGEDCDDGNKLNGDGCDENCLVEPGYMCTAQEGDCERNANGDCILRIPVTYRDFDASHSDFESGCAGDVATTGILNSTLSSGKPSLSGAVSNMCTTGFADWYVDGSNSTTFHSELVLYDDGSGNFVNRYGANGEQWYTKLGWNGATNCAVAPHCGPYDGSPFFFPVDGIPNARGDMFSTAQVSTMEYGMDGTTRNEVDLTGSATMHNFSFTSEVAYWFAYDDDTNATLSFAGDDDVWVYVNGQLALDLGGLHPALAGTVSVNSGTAGGYGMTAGNVYEIKVFHAERHTTGSTFKLTLSGFNTRRSDCTATCGDGIVGFGEQCDDGENDGGYNECGANCRIGSYCGDGIKDEGETCDDNDPAAPAECNGCRIIVVK